MTWKPLGDCTNCGARLFTNGFTVEDDWSGIHCISWSPLARNWQPNPHQPPKENHDMAKQTYSIQAPATVTFAVTAESWEDVQRQAEAWKGRFLDVAQQLGGEDAEYCNGAIVAVVQYHGDATLTHIDDAPVTLL